MRVRVRVRVRVRATPTPSPTPDLREGGYGAAVRGRALQQLDRLELGELDETERGARGAERVLEEAQLRASAREVEEAAHLAGEARGASCLGEHGLASTAWT